MCRTKCLPRHLNRSEQEGDSADSFLAALPVQGPLDSLLQPPFCQAPLSSVTPAQFPFAPWWVVQIFFATDIMEKL